MGNLCVTRERTVVDERYLRYAEIHAGVRRLVLDREALEAECDETFKKSRLDEHGNMHKEELEKLTQRFIDKLYCDDPHRIQAISDAYNDLGSRSYVTPFEFRGYMVFVLREIESDLRMKVEQFRPYPDGDEDGLQPADLAPVPPPLPEATPPRNNGGNFPPPSGGGVGQEAPYVPPPSSGAAQTFQQSQNNNFSQDPRAAGFQSAWMDRSSLPRQQYGAPPDGVSDGFDPMGRGPQTAPQAPRQHLSAEAYPGVPRAQGGAPQNANNAQEQWASLPPGGGTMAQQPWTSSLPPQQAPRQPVQSQPNLASYGQQELQQEMQQLQEQQQEQLRVQQQQLQEQQLQQQQLQLQQQQQFQQQQSQQPQQPVSAVYAGAPPSDGFAVFDDSQARSLGGAPGVYRQNQNGSSPDFGQMEVPSAYGKEAQLNDNMRGPTTPDLDLLCAGQHGQDSVHTPVGGGIPQPSMSVEEMRQFMQDEGVPLFVYNKQLETEPKRLLLDPSHSILSLWDNDLEDDLDADRGLRGEACASFELADLEEIQLGEQCNFARLLQPTYDTSDPLLMAMMEPQAPTDRLAAFKFAEAGGCLCVRFLSSTLKDAAIDVFHEICPHVRIVGN